MGKIFSIQLEKGTLNFSSISDRIVRCVFTAEGEIKEPSLLVSAEQNEEIPVEKQENESKICLKMGKVLVEFDRKSESVSWYRTDDGFCYAKEVKRSLEPIKLRSYFVGNDSSVIQKVKTVDGERNFVENMKEEVVGKSYRGKLHFRWEKEEGIYGLGQAEEGIFNYRGHHQYLYQHNMRTPMPVFVSSRNYGVFFDCGSLMTFQDDQEGSYVYLDAAPQMDYYMITGDCMDEVISGIRFVTGKAALLPKWAYGYIQSKEQYYTAKELTDVAKKYRDLSIPLDCVVQDWNTWTEDNWGEKIVDPARYGDLKERMEELHNMNVHCMFSIWPNMNEDGENFKELQEAGCILQDYATYNAFDERAREIYWEQTKRGLFDLGVDAFWCDSTEPFAGPDWNGAVKRESWERFVLVGGEHKKYLGEERANLFGLVHAKGIFENQRKTTEDVRVLNLTRSGYLSGQQYGAVLWSGDIVASWDTMRKQIAEGLNMSMSGYPYWTLDIGGFFTVGKKWQNRGCGSSQNPTPKWFWNGEYDDGVHNPAYCELYTRWLQMGVFLPMFRSHGTDTPREIWNFGKEGDMFYDAIAKYIRLRYRLMPYIYSLAGEVYWNNGTFLRSLVFDFPEDTQALNMADEYMFGPALLVCPVLEAMYYNIDGSSMEEKEKVRKCYLPDTEGGWYDYHTGAHFEGGRWIEVTADIEHMPVFVKAGSVLPQTEGLQYADEKNGNPLELHVYPGCDGEFSIYEDEGNSYGYEEGNCSWIPVKWENSSRTLTILERRGEFPGMETDRKIEVYIGEKKTEREYFGKEIKILL